jgi:hypothetical protein
MKLTFIVSILAAVAAATPALAHHSFAAEFDASKPLDVTGIVTKVDWANPHIYFYVDVEGDGGEVANWAIEMGSPNGLMRRGWTRNSLKVGDVISVSGSRAKDGSLKGNARQVTLASGERLFAGTSQPDVDDAQ